MLDVLKFDYRCLPDGLVKVSVYSGEGQDQIFAGDLVLQEEEWARLSQALQLGSERSELPIRITSDVRELLVKGQS